jgi:predicted MFS family arabinose efflux permease
MSAPARRRGGLWRQRDFGLFWTGESISEVGNSVTIVVTPLVAIETLHASTFIVTVLNAAIWLPWLIIGVPAGAWVDRLRPRLVMLTCDAISMAAYASVPVAGWLGVLTVAQLIAVTLIAGAATVFFRSAYQVLLPGIVGEEDLAEGNAKLMGSREVAQIGGPGLGGMLAQIAGPAVGLLADAASFAISFTCLTAVRRPRDRRPAAPRTSSLTHEALHGLRFLWHDPYLRVMASFSALANLGLTGVDALIIIFLVRTIGLSAAAAGLAVASFGIGGVTGALVARPLGQRFGTARALLIANIGGLSFSLLLPLAHAGPGLAFAVISNVLAACGVVAANIIGASFRQTYVPPELLGRVSSVTMTVAYAAMPAGALLAGLLATTLGIRPALWILTALISASGLLYLPTPIRRLRDLPPNRPATGNSDSATLDGAAVTTPANGKRRQPGGTDRHTSSARPL